MYPLEVLTAGPYNLLFAAGFAIAFALAWWEGRRSHQPPLAWLTLLAVCAAGGIIGAKVLHLDLVQGAPGGKTILGGVLGAALALVIARSFLRLDPRSPDRLAPLLVPGFVLWRMGCFLAGCCFGHPTNLPWGVHYGPGTEPYAVQLDAGMIQAGAAASLPVHPTQLYEAALALLLLVALGRSRSRLRQPGSVVLALAGGYGLARFAVEFYRVDGAEQLYYGLKAVQWALVLVVAACVTLLLWREYLSRHGVAALAPARHAAAPLRPVILLGIVAAVAGVAAGWLTPLERITLLGVMLPATLLLLFDYRTRVPWAAAPGVVAATLLLQVPADVPDEYPRSYYTLGGSAMTGRYADICGTTRQYTVGGASFGYTHQESPTRKYSGRAQVFYGGERAELDNLRQSIRGAALSGSGDWEWFGFTLGGITGDEEAPVLPILGLRLGQPEGFFVDARLLDHEPTPLPAPALQLGLGYRSLTTGSQLRLGISDAGFFIGGTWVTGGGTEIQPFLAYGDEQHHQLGLALRQRFGGRGPGR